MQYLPYIYSPIVVFVVGYFLARLAGKRAVSQMNAFDLMFILIIGTTISEPIVSDDNWLAIWYSFAIALLYLGISRLALENRFKRLLTEEPTVLIRNGDIDEKGIEESHLTVEELLGQLRLRGYTRTTDVEMATMEEGGQISVIPKAEYRTVQMADLHLNPKPAFVSIPLVTDGEIIHHNLRFLKKDTKWLYEQLRKQQVTPEELHEITLATYDQGGQIFIDRETPPANKGDGTEYQPGD